MFLCIYVCLHLEYVYHGTEVKTVIKWEILPWLLNKELRMILWQDALSLSLSLSFQTLCASLSLSVPLSLSH